MKFPTFSSISFTDFLIIHRLMRRLHREVIGIPSAVNMYGVRSGFIFFTDLGFSVKLSPASNKKVYEDGMESIPSESYAIRQSLHMDI